MSVELAIEFIQGVGFPIFVSIYLLLYLKKEVVIQQQTLTELKSIIHHLSDYIKRGA